MYIYIPTCIGRCEGIAAAWRARLDAVAAHCHAMLYYTMLYYNRL